jgi:hypothetical protein
MLTAVENISGLRHAAKGKMAVDVSRPWQRGRHVAIRVQNEAHDQSVREVDVAHVGWRVRSALIRDSSASIFRHIIGSRAGMRETLETFGMDDPVKLSDRWNAEFDGSTR